MAKDLIEKTLILLDEDEVRQAMHLARNGDIDAIYRFMRDVIAKKVEAALRMRC
jgi:hypothetical protein